jgi:hypothetical protein
MRILSFLALLATASALTINFYGSIPNVTLIESSPAVVDEYYLVVEEDDCIEEETTETNETASTPNSCISFIVGSGTGCGWMCQYCANQLGTNNYYFTDGVCTYESGGCVGNPVEGNSYTCCSA